jgi:hypothetical protein
MATSSKSPAITHDVVKRIFKEPDRERGANDRYDCLVGRWLMKSFLILLLWALVGGVGLATAIGGPEESFVTEHIEVRNGVARCLGQVPETWARAVAAANRIAGKPYRYSGGHGVWEDVGYDCSGATSYVLHAAGLLKEAMSSSAFLEYGEPGPGKWITVYARAGHVFLLIGGARFDTTDRANIGPGWRADARAKGFTMRHPSGY